MDDTPRWKYRFDNYSMALDLLREGVAGMGEREYSQLEKEGLVRRAKRTIDLAWKVMKDYLESENVVFEQLTPRTVVRTAFESNLVSHGEIWMDALDARNRMSHTYNVTVFEDILTQTRERFLGILDELYHALKPRVSRSK